MRKPLGKTEILEKVADVIKKNYIIKSTSVTLRCK